MFDNADRDKIFQTLTEGLGHGAIFSKKSGCRPEFFQTVFRSARRHYVTDSDYFYFPTTLKHKVIQ